MDENTMEPETYEAKRARRIAENARVLQTLQLEPVAAPPVQHKKPAPSSHKKRKIETTEEEPSERRVSLRRLKLDPDGLEAKEALAKEQEKHEAEMAKMKRVEGDFELSTYFLGSDDGDLQIYKDLMRNASDTKASLISRSSMPAKFSLDMRDGKRFRATKDRIYSLAIHPYVNSNRVLAIAGDKQGEVAFAWTPIHPTEDVEQDIYTFRVHKRPVTNLEVALGAPQYVFTSSYEGAVRRTDLNTLVCEELYGKDNDLITTFSTTKSGDLLYFSNTDGVMSLIDLRAKTKPVSSYAALSERKVSGIQLNPLDPNYIATSTLARNVAIFDIRNLPSSSSKKHSKPISTFDHGKSASSIYWSPDATKLVSTSFDDTLGLFEWNKGSMKFVKSIKHFNQTGRWVTNFKAKFFAQSDAIAVGGMKQTLDVFGADGRVLANCTSEHVTAIPAVVAPSPVLPYVIATGNASGRIEVWAP